MLITPEYVFQDVTHITPEWLAAKGIRALVLDIDNTLTADRSQELPEEVAQWLAEMRNAGIGLTIVSNGAEKRVRPFAEKLGLAYLYRSAKPLPFALMVARRRMGVRRREMVMVGDQLYGRGTPGANLDLDRQFLHSWSLAFTHPATGEAMKFIDSPSYELQEALESIESRSMGRTQRGAEVLGLLEQTEPSSLW